MCSTSANKPEKAAMNVQQQMQNRSANGLDPLTGRPMQVTGPISAYTDGTCRDATGAIVTLSKYGDWVPVQCAS